MSINTIREGNILYKNGYVKVTQELANEIGESSIIKSGYTAIKLTPSLFEAVGFIKQADKPARLMKYEDIYWLNLVSATDTTVPKYKAVIQNGGDDRFTVFELHELQNAYADLTNEELNTKQLLDNQ